MNEDKFPVGTRVMVGGRTYVGTVKGDNVLKNDLRMFAVSFDNGQSDVVEERYLRIATEEDEAKSAEVIKRNRDTARRMTERKAAAQRRRVELEDLTRQQKQANAAAAEEAVRQAKIAHTNEMRKANARTFGLESLRRN